MLNIDELPYVTADVPGIGGRIKVRPADFLVEEVPLYQPSGEGTSSILSRRESGATLSGRIERR